MKKTNPETDPASSIDSEIEVSILACPYDTGFLRYTVPHLIRSLGSVSTLRTLLVDYRPVTGYYSTVYPKRQEEKFEAICAEFVATGRIDRVVKIPYEPSYVSKFLKKTVKGKFHSTHNIRGYPIYGSMIGVLNSKKRYLVHFDSDMLIHQGITENWIELGVSLLQKFSDIGAVMPLGGPPTTDGSIHQSQEKYSLDCRGFHSFSSFSSRVFLVDVKRFWSLHPVKPLWLGRRDKLRSFWDGKGKSLSWESIISNAFQKRGLLRADLLSTDSWSLHPPTKDETYLKYLPAIISMVEEGKFPSEQSGHYDLELECWKSFLEDS